MRTYKLCLGVICIALVAVVAVGCSKTNPLDDLTEWDLVYISDSTGWGVAKKFAANIERDTGKAVRVHDYSVGSLSALKVLHALQSDPESMSDMKLKSLRADVAEAEVIIFFANPRGDPSEGGVRDGMEQCISYRSGNLPKDCTSQLYEPYTKNLKAIYQEMFALRNENPTIIRAVDFYNPVISGHRKANLETECTQCWETYNAEVRAAADAFNVPLVSIYDAFNGVRHDEDPREKEYIGSDGVHASEQGQQVIADLLSQAGYEPVQP